MECCAVGAQGHKNQEWARKLVHLWLWEVGKEFVLDVAIGIGVAWALVLPGRWCWLFILSFPFRNSFRCLTVTYLP